MKQSDCFNLSEILFNFNFYFSLTLLSTTIYLRNTSTVIVTIYRYFKIKI